MDKDIKAGLQILTVTGTAGAAIGGKIGYSRSEGSNANRTAAINTEYNNLRQTEWSQIINDRHGDNYFEYDLREHTLVNQQLQQTSAQRQTTAVATVNSDFPSATPDVLMGMAGGFLAGTIGLVIMLNALSKGATAIQNKLSNIQLPEFNPRKILENYHDKKAVRRELLGEGIKFGKPSRAEREWLKTNRIEQGA
ncbi:MAG: hypothetical protein FWE38_05555 [Firmicutes bacterium]|nr:hypothetical protein [Bacillota bacterium]